MGLGLETVTKTFSDRTSPRLKMSMKITVMYRDNHNHNGPFPYRNWRIVNCLKEFFKIRESNFFLEDSNIVKH